METKKRFLNTKVIIVGFLLLSASTLLAQQKDSVPKRLGLLQERDSIPKNLDMGQYTFLDTAKHEVSIKDFKGKYVFMDLWASWCGPCIHEFPYFDSLKKEFKSKNIVFLQLSIDGGLQRWQFAMSMYGRHDNQWFLNGNKQFGKDLRISSIPRYLLIDKNGKLIDAYMTRASDAVTRTTLSKLKGI